MDLSIFQSGQNDLLILGENFKMWIGLIADSADHDQTAGMCHVSWSALDVWIESVAASRLKVKGYKAILHVHVCCRKLMVTISTSFSQIRQPNDDTKMIQTNKNQMMIYLYYCIYRGIYQRPRDHRHVGESCTENVLRHNLLRGKTHNRCQN
jgi:hypothetical protein